MKPDDRALTHDLAALSSGLRHGIALATADLGHGLELGVGLEKDASGARRWRVLITGTQGLESDVRLSDPDCRELRVSLDRAITEFAGRAWKIGRNPVTLVDTGVCTIGVAVAAGSVWAVAFIGSKMIRLPASDLGRLRDALAAAATRIGRAGVVPQPAAGVVQ